MKIPFGSSLPPPCDLGFVKCSSSCTRSLVSKRTQLCWKIFYLTFAGQLVSSEGVVILVVLTVKEKNSYLDRDVNLDFYIPYISVIELNYINSLVYSSQMKLADQLDFL